MILDIAKSLALGEITASAELDIEIDEQLDRVVAAKRVALMTSRMVHADKALDGLSAEHLNAFAEHEATRLFGERSVRYLNADLL